MLWLAPVESCITKNALPMALKPAAGTLLFRLPVMTTLGWLGLGMVVLSGTACVSTAVGEANWVSDPTLTSFRVSTTPVCEAFEAIWVPGMSHGSAACVGAVERPVTPVSGMVGVLAPTK